MAKNVRITKLTNSQIKAYCKANGWQSKHLPCGYPNVMDITDIAEGNAPEILEEAFEANPNQTIYEYVALRTCQDDADNPSLWDKNEND